jgi:hypothetical protein
VLKASIASTLALAAVVSVAGCSGKHQESTSAAPAAANPSAAPTMPEGHPAAQAGASVDLTNIAKADGGQTVADLYAQKADLAGKNVAVRGKVVKVNRGIMGKDWLHVRDGSGADGTNDLTVTTTSTPLPNVGDLVVVSGTLTTDKDYGMGYSYPVIVEDAQVTIETPAQE